MIQDKLDSTVPEGQPEESVHTGCFIRALLSWVVLVVSVSGLWRGFRRMDLPFPEEEYSAAAMGFLGMCAGLFATIWPTRWGGWLSYAVGFLGTASAFLLLWSVGVLFCHNAIDPVGRLGVYTDGWVRELANEQAFAMVGVPLVVSISLYVVAIRLGRSAVSSTPTSSSTLE